MADMPESLEVAANVYVALVRRRLGDGKAVNLPDGLHVCGVQVRPGFDLVADAEAAALAETTERKCWELNRGGAGLAFELT